MTDNDNTTQPQSGFELKLQLTNYNRRDDRGNPVTHTNLQHMTNYELAKANEMEIVQMYIELAAKQIIDTLRGDYDD